MKPKILRVISCFVLLTFSIQQIGFAFEAPLNLKLKTYGHGTLYNFAIDNLTSTPQTYWFPLAGKQGTEVEVTVEPQRVPEGVNKSGSVFIDGINYVAVKKLDKPLWEAEVGMTVADARSIKTESENLVSVGREIATGKPLRYDRLVPLLDLPTRMIYSDLSAAVTGELVNFRRFDGSVVELNGKTVTQVILPDGTVNDYSGTGNAGAGVIHGPDSGEGGANLTDYRYGALRKITQSDGHELDFSYEFDESGAEITVIKDLVSKDERRFKDGKLLRSDSADKTETRYRYADGELAAAEFTYKNKVIESTRYRFANDETQVTDDRGTTWFYDANGNLTRHLTKDGYLFRYADHTMTLPAGTTPDPGDYKSKIYGKSGLKAVHLAGYEANDGSQLLYDAENPGKSEIKLIEGDHAVNIEMDSARRIKSGQVQFKDGLIIEIENYVPARGRLASGELFSVSLPQAEKTEILQSDTGEFTGIRLTIDGKYFIYDALGNLTKVESSDGKTDSFTYRKDVLGRLTGYTRLNRVQLVINGVPFPKEVSLSAGDPQKFFDSGKEVASHDGNGFILGVYKESLNQWDVYSGTFGSEGDRLAVKNFLKEVKPGQSVAAVVSDPSFSNLDEETLALFESLGAGELRAAAAANSKWGFFGNKGLKPGDGYESVGEVQISTVTETVTDVNFAPNADQDFDGRPMFLRMPASVADAYSRFLTRYETLRIRDDMNILTVYDKTDEIVYAKRADGMSTYYDLGKMRETYTDRGDLSYVYDYGCPADGCKTGEDMQLKKITLVKARNDFEREAERLNEEIEQAKFDALYRLAWQDEVARLKIKENVDSGIAAITAEIGRLEPMRYREVTQCSFGWCGEVCNTQTVEDPNVTSAINNLYSQRDELWRTQQEQLAKLPGEIAAKKLEIEQASSSAVQDLEKKKAEILFDLLQKEIQPILMDYYRRILGRDPSTQEESDWINRFKDTQAVDVALLESELGGSLEKKTREEERAALIAGVESFLRDYLTLTESQKAARLTALQLSPSETVSLDSAEVESILTYLKSRGLHFGQSAFLSLRSMLLARGVDAPAAALGLEAVLIDILTGTINPLTEGELLVSVFAMNRVAKIHGREFAGVRYSFDDLKALYNNACPAGGDCEILVMARVGEDHFVVVTKVTDTEVTCFETGKGKDGEAVTMTRDSFVKAWKAEEDGKGYLVVDTKDATAANRLTDEEAQRIRGSFWPLVFFIAALVLMAASAIVSPYSPTLGKILGIAAMVAGILSIVASVGSWVVQGAKMAYTSIAQQGFFQTVWSGLKGVGNFLVQSVRYVGRFFQEGFQFVKATFSQGLSKLGSGIISAKNFVLNPTGKEIIVNGVKTKLFTTGQQAARSLIAVGINMGVSRGLEGLGLNPALANLAGAFTGFGAIGLGTGLSGFIKSGLQGMMLAGVSEMGLKLNLPPPITGAISLLTSAALKSYFDPTLTLKTALTEIAPQVSSQFVLGGMDLLGRSLGMDPRISRLIGLPISAAVGGLVETLVNSNGGGGPGAVFNAIKDALFDSKTLGGIVTYGADILLDKIGAPALFRGFVPGLLGQIVAKIGGDANKGGNVFGKMMNGISKFGGKITGGIRNGISFSAEVLKDGVGFLKRNFAKAVDLFSGILRSEERETMVKYGGGSIEEAVFTKAAVNGGDVRADFGEFQLGWNSFANEYYVTGDGFEQSAKDVWMTGENAYSGVQITVSEAASDGVRIKYVVDDGMLKELDAFNLQTGDILSRIQAQNRDKGLEVKSDGSLFTGIFENFLTGTAYAFEGGSLVSTAIIRKDSEGIFSLTSFVDPLGQMKVAYNLGASAFDQLYKTQNALYDQYIETTSALRDFIKEVFNLDGPNTKVYNHTINPALAAGVAVVDMKLDWYKFLASNELEDLGSFAADFLIGGAANRRWRQAINDAVPKLVDQIRNKANKFIFTPGVNSGFKDGVTDDGYTAAEINALAESFAADGKQVMVAHSAGTEAQLKALLAAKQQGIALPDKVVFFSPRVSRLQFEWYLDQIGLRPDQILVVTAAGDLPHLPTDVLTDGVKLAGGVGGTVSSLYLDYENNLDESGKIKYNYVYMETDLTYEADRINNEKQLGHGGMLSGAMEDHEYQIVENGQRKQRARLRDLYLDFMNRNQ